VKPPYIFSGGDSVSWSLAKVIISDKFKSEGVWDEFIYHSMNVPNLEELAEYRFLDELEEHDVFVEAKINRYNAEILRHHNVIIDFLNGIAPPPTDLGTRILEEELDYRRKQGNEVKKREDFEREYVAHKAAFKTAKHLYDKSIASCYKVFQESFHPSILQGVRYLLNSKEFKRAWIEIDNKYSTLSGGVSSQIQLMNLLNATIFNGGDINHHLSKINGLCNELTIDGDIADQTRAQYLINSIRKGTNRDFDAVLTFHQLCNSGYNDIADALLTRNSQLLLERAVNHMSRPKSSNSEKVINATVSSHACTECGKEGYAAASCFKNKKCNHCGRTGHPAERCFMNPESPQFRPDYQPKANNTEGVRLTEENKSKQVSIANSFAKRHPKPNKKK